MTDVFSPPASSRLYDTSARVQHILHIDTMVVEGIDGDLFDLLTDDIGELLAELLEVEHLDEWLNQYAREGRSATDFERRESLVEALHSKPLRGWLVQGATPVKTPHPGGGGYGLSWGHYSTEWFYGETYDQAVEQVIVWAESDCEKALADGKAMAK